MNVPPAACPARSSDAAAGERLDRMIRAAQADLLRRQGEDGHWRFELETDTIVVSWYVMLQRFLGRCDGPRIDACCERLRRQQLETGGWANYPGGAVDPSASVQAYLCLKLAGDDPAAPWMVAARDAIRRAGGLQACHSYTKLFLAVFGLWDWRRAPGVPPEMILAPRWAFLNLGEISCWSRAIVVPLSVVWASRPHVPVGLTLDELEVDSAPARRRTTVFEWFWGNAFKGVDKLIKFVEAVGPVPFLRRRALRKAEAFILSGAEAADGLGSFILAALYAVKALRCLGYEADHPAIQSQLREIERLGIMDGDELRFEPTLSPVWDTVLSTTALLEAEPDDSAAAIRAGVDWLLDQEVSVPGQWQWKSLQDAPGAWCFQYKNDLHPDCDDSAAVLFVLSRVRGHSAASEERREGAMARCRRWLLGMQNPDGGWAAFERRCNKRILTFLPFADHNAMLDPSTADVTSRVARSLLAAGSDPAERPIRRCLSFLLREQEDDGSWRGRWGANHVYGTWLALSALGPVSSAPPGGFESRLPSACQRGRRWLLGHQNEDGGWGESLDTYYDHGRRGHGDSTAAQTAWAMMGLLASVEAAPDLPEVDEVTAAIDRAVCFLDERQLAGGAWRDASWTGVGFPRVVFLRYDGYPRYFPLQALGAYRRFRRRLAAKGRRGAT